MDSNRCLTCLFGDKCHEEYGDCGYYFPLGEASENEAIDERNYSEFISFLEEWIIYTEEDESEWAYYFYELGE